MKKTKILISSPCNLIGEYTSDFCRVKHAWEFKNTSYSKSSVDEQYFFVVEVGYDDKREINEIEKMYLNDNGRIFCVIFAVLYGKIFYSHGAFESDNLYLVPDVKYIKHKYKKYLPYNSIIRKDTDVKLELEEINKIENIFNIHIYETFKRFIATATQYLIGLEFINTDPDIGYLSLVQSGEIFSNIIHPGNDNLIDENILKILKEIEVLENGEEKSKLIKSRMFQIQRKYTKVLKKYLDEKFYLNSPSMHNIHALNSKNVEKLLKNSYELRSQYIHSGDSFGELTVIDQIFNNEFNNGYRENMSKELKKKLQNSLSFCGLERIIHYCLFKHLMNIVE